MTVCLALVAPMVTGRLDRQVDQKVGNVVSRRTRVFELFEMLLSANRFARVDHLTLGEKQETVK
jgi:hypothetical protein